MRYQNKILFNYLELDSENSYLIPITYKIFLGNFLPGDSIIDIHLNVIMENIL